MTAPRTISSRIGRHQDATVYHAGEAFGVSMARVGASIVRATFPTLSAAFDCQDAFMLGHTAETAIAHGNGRAWQRQAEVEREA